MTMRQPRHRLERAATRPLRSCPSSPRCPWRRRAASMMLAPLAARRRATARARSARWPSRSVTMPTVCGRSDAVLERRAALVVDQHEGHRVRPVADRQRGDERLQQLGLAGAGGAGDQRVRPVLPDVEPERAVGRLADDRRRSRAAGPPPAGHALGSRRLEGDARRAAGPRSAAADSSSPADVAHRGERASDARSHQPASHQVGADPGRRASDRSAAARPGRSCRRGRPRHSSGSSRSSASRQIT